jgi:microcystin-dependent protein
MCNGQLLAIAQNQALFSLLGTNFGGNGIQTFGLPNLQGRVPFHFGNGYVLGQSSGEAAHTLISSEVPTHTHQAFGSTAATDQASPTNNYWATPPGYTSFAAQKNEAMSTAAIANTGGNQPHENMSPYLVLNFCIALVGIFPSRN